MTKDAVLTSIRRGLRRGALTGEQADLLRKRLGEHPRHLIPARSRLPHAEQVDLFVRNVEKEFGTVSRVEDVSDVPDAVATYLTSQNLTGDAAMAPHPELRIIPWSVRPLLSIREGRAEGGGSSERATWVCGDCRDWNAVPAEPAGAARDA